jgi:hypothetical protein
MNIPNEADKGIMYIIIFWVLTFIACHVALATGGMAEKKDPRISGIRNQIRPYVIQKAIVDKPR